MIIPNSISLVITTYNRSHLLKRAIDSIYDMPFNEIIVVNDGSDKEHDKIIDSILLKYPKIIYLKHSINRGLGEARNSGVRLSKSEWIMYLDDDDYFIDNPIPELKELIKKNKDISVINFKIRNQQLNKDVVDWGHEKFTLEELIEHNRLAGCSMLKKEVWEILNGYKTMPYEDWEFWIRAKRVNFKFLFFPGVFYFRESHSEGLETVFGNKISDEEWKNKYLYYMDRPITRNTDIAIGITTFLRDSSLIKLINSILTYLPEFKIYVADQGSPSKQKDEIYNFLRQNGHHIEWLPYDSGISKTRRVLKDICKEPYLVYMEDDFQVTEKTNLYAMQQILEENPEIGVVGGNLQGYTKTGAYSYFFNRADNKICYFPLDYLINKKLFDWEYTSNNIKFLRADIVSDFTMWKKEVPNIFDDNVKTIEHTHVYLLIKYKTNYKVAFCPDSEIKHVHGQENKEYDQLRSRKTDLIYLKKYWNIDDFYQFNQDKLIEIEKMNPSISDIKITPSNVSKDTGEVQSLKNINLITNDDKRIKKFINWLNINNVSFCVVKNTCLKCITKKIISDDSDSFEIDIKDSKNLTIVNEYIKNNNLNVKLYVDTIKKTKVFNLGPLSINVPCPVIQYLEKTFKQTWKELQNE